jgi:hypothetical protein
VRPTPCICGTLQTLTIRWFDAHRTLQPCERLPKKNQGIDTPSCFCRYFWFKCLSDDITPFKYTAFNRNAISGTIFAWINPNQLMRRPTRKIVPRAAIRGGTLFLIF